VIIASMGLGDPAVIYRWRDEMADLIETAEAGRD
jgi:hypothetical protein